MNPVNPIPNVQLGRVADGGPKGPVGVARNGTFARTLQASLETGTLRFSAHARERLADRGLDLANADIARIAESVDLAAAKGSRQSVVMLDGLALIVGVPSRTVVTVLEPNRNEHAVFTNIDSLVVAAEDRSTEAEKQRPDPVAGGLGAADRWTRR